MNQSGTFLLGLLRTDQDRDALVRALADEFEIDAADAARDTDSFLDALRQENLLV